MKANFMEKLSYIEDFPSLFWRMGAIARVSHAHNSLFTLLSVRYDKIC